MGRAMVGQAAAGQPTSLPSRGREQLSLAQSGLFRQSEQTSHDSDIEADNSPNHAVSKFKLKLVL